MMRKADVDEYAAKRPFEPFEIRLNDGHRYRFMRMEQFLVARGHIVTLDRKLHTRFISIGLISEIGPVTRGGRRRPRREADR
jgi:hypothetical protein